MSTTGDLSPSRDNRNSPYMSRQKKGSDAGSVFSDQSEGRGIRASIEGAIERFRTHDSGGQGEKEDHGLKKLTRVVSRRRRKKRMQQEEEIAQEEAARGRDVADRGTLEDNSPYAIRKELSSGGSSLLTYETDDESPSAVPPPLASHPSHIGYLTTSSPLIKSGNLLRESPTASNKSVSPTGSSSMPAQSASTTTESLEAPQQELTRRPTSPVNKLKESFSRRSTSPSVSPERKTNGTVRRKNDGGGTSSRRSSVAARIGAIFPGGPPSQQQETQSPAERLVKPKAPYKIETSNGRPHTPPTNEVNAPRIISTPPTPTEPVDSPRFASPNPSNSNIITSASGNMISHRRVRSASGASGVGPSRLSNLTSPPLAPTPENRSISSSTSAPNGFFSSVFTAAQTAATTLTNSISNTNLPGQNRMRSGTVDSKDLQTIDDVEVEGLDNIQDGGNPENKEPAVKTLGLGDLSLSQLGIPEATSSTPIVGKLSDSVDIANTASAPTLVPEASATMSPAGDERARSWSLYELSENGRQTSPNGSVFEDKTTLGRASSIRSALGSARRKRGSSAATNATAVKALAANLQAAGPGHKITGFAVASKKRNRDFHQLFRSVPEDDYLIEDYSCALQREILAHGRLYVSEGHLCFSSNIFGWVTTLVISFDEIVSIEKRSTALLFKNGLMISTLHAKHVFASFTSRDSTYDLIVGIWKLGHPDLRSSLNGVLINETGGDKTEKADGNSHLDSESESSSDEEIYDEDELDEDGTSFAGDDDASFSDHRKPASRKPSAAVASNGAGSAGAEAAAGGAVDFPGPPTHAPTQCNDADAHYDKVIADEIISAPLGKVYNLMFGPASVSWMSKWLTDQKMQDLEMTDEKGLSNENKTRSYSYIKPLFGAIGPKQTKCIITDTLDFLDLEKSVSVTCATVTPDVPSGNVFTTKTKYCLMWAENNTTRMLMTCTIEWTGKSWLKTPIEKGANDGQLTYAKELVTSLRSAVSARPRGNTAGREGRPRRKGKKGAATGSSVPAPSKVVVKPENWGLFDPLRPVLGPVADILKPFTSGNMLYGLLVGLLVASWFSFGYKSMTPSSDMGQFHISSAERIAVYEEIWRREESELWEWLEARVGLERLAQVSKSPDGEVSPEMKRGLEERLRGEDASDREVETAMRVTEEKLKVLKNVVENKKSKGATE